jgi:formylglycine-generating enzyme required for sulfatase activity
MEFLMGSPDHEQGRNKDEALHRRLIPRSYAIATKEVTVKQFTIFRRDNPSLARQHPSIEELESEGAMGSVTWFEAIQYCRWLSEQEQVPEEQMCYPSIAEIEKARDGKAMLKLPADYLTRTGYRLPTEAEWEHACRAGTVMSRFWGTSPARSKDYTSQGLPLSVGLQKPNDLGLFDMLGNVAEWCQDRFLPYPRAGKEQVSEDREDWAAVSPTDLRVLRGGSFESPVTDLRCAARSAKPPTKADPTVGFRVARTFSE